MSLLLYAEWKAPIIERAKHLLHLENVVKILAKYGEDDLAQLVQERLNLRVEDQRRKTRRQNNDTPIR